MNYRGKFHSFMIKIIRNDWVLIKATPRFFGYGGGHQLVGQDDDDYGGGGGYGDGKGRDDRWEKHGKSDWKEYPKRAP
eukprot:13596735-Heterocapsa_arctica.AAC.1